MPAIFSCGKSRINRICQSYSAISGCHHSLTDCVVEENLKKIFGAANPSQNPICSTSARHGGYAVVCGWQIQFFFCSFSIAFRPALYTSQFVSLMSVPLCAFKRLRFWKKKKKENATGFVCPSLNHQVASFAARLDSILKRTVERKLLHKCA